MKRYVKSGVSFNDDSYEFDYENDSLNDIVSLKSYRIKSSTFRGDVYWFGYEFNPGVSSKERTKFIHALKGLSNINIPYNDLQAFIEKPIVELNRVHRLGLFDFFAYPVSGRSPLVSYMIQEVGNWIQRDISDVSFRLIKNLPSEIKFDWVRFKRDYDSDDKSEHNRFVQMSEYVNNVLIPSIESGSYFSLANSVKAKYRPYITNFLMMENSDIAKMYELDNASVLVVDDINTTGSTLYEILRILDKVNSSLNVYVFTLIGKPSNL